MNDTGFDVAAFDLDGTLVRTSGFSVEELQVAEAAGVYESLTELVKDLDQTELGAAARPQMLGTGAEPGSGAQMDAR